MKKHNQPSPRENVIIIRFTPTCTVVVSQILPPALGIRELVVVLLTSLRSIFSTSQHRPGNQGTQGLGSLSKIPAAEWEAVEERGLC